MILLPDIIEYIVRFLDNTTLKHFKKINYITELFFINNSSIYKKKIVDIYKKRVIFLSESLTVKSKCLTNAFSIYH